MFDPYHKWLGIRDPQRPPNYYRLLGIESFESDTDVIVAAADRQMAHLRKYQAGDRAELSQQILNELATAKICLLNEDTRKAYDASLRSAQVAQPQPGATPEIQIDTSQPFVPGLPGRKSALRRMLPALIGGALIIGFPLGLKVAGVFDRAPRISKTNNEPPIDTSEPAIPPPSPDLGTDLLDSSDEADNVPAEEQTTEEVEPESPSNAMAAEGDRPENVSDPLSHDETDSTDLASPSERRLAPWNLPQPPHRVPAPPSPKYAGAYRALTNRSPEDVFPIVGRMSQYLRKLEDRQLLAQIEMQADYLSAFWQSVDVALERLQPGIPLNYNGHPVTVLAVNSVSLELEAATGDTREFEIARKRMSGDLAVALAEYGASLQGANPNAAIVAFLSLDRQGNASRAQQVARSAARSGLAFELLRPAPMTNRPLVTDISNAGKKASPVADPTAEADLKLAVPTSEQQDQALRLVHHLFETPMRNTSPAGRRELAQSLLKLARKTRDDAAAKYVMLQWARDLSIATGDLDTAWESSVKLGHEYDLDDLDLQHDTYNKLVRKIRDDRKLLALIAMGRDLVWSAIENDEYHHAKQMASAMLAAARQTKDAAIVKRTQQLVADVKATETGYRKVALAREQLRSDPEDPIANAEVGKFLALVKGDFATGLPHLAKSTDPTLRSMAIDELNSDLDGRGLEIGDRWWEFSKGRDGLQARNVQQHAIHYYRKVVPELDGITKTRVLSRIEEGASSILGNSEKRLAEALHQVWKIIWTDHPTWDRLEFLSNGESRLSAGGKVWPNHWYATADTIRILSKDRRTLFVLRALEAGKLQCGKFDTMTSQLLCIGQGKPIAPE